jgi:hypothetical protein
LPEAKLKFAASHSASTGVDYLLHFTQRFAPMFLTRLSEMVANIAFSVFDVMGFAAGLVGLPRIIYRSR